MKISHSIFIAIFLFGLTGCATTLHTIPTDYALGAKEESVVIGRVIIDMGETIKPIGFFDRLSKIVLSVEDATGGLSAKRYTIICDRGGSDSIFVVTLPPGRYKITGIQRGNMESHQSGSFEVGSTQIVYIGTLKYEGEGLFATMAASILSGRSVIPGGWYLNDNYEETVKFFRENYLHMNQEIVKALMTLD
jgi:hypothetical protein